MALLLLIVSELPAQSASGIDRSVVVLLDASYSMALRSAHSGQRRIDVAMRAARELVRRSAAGEEWSLIVMEDRSQIEIASGFATDPASRAGWRQGFEPAGSTPLGEGLDRAAGYLSAAGRGAAKCVLLLTDGIATEDDAFRLPSPEYFASRAISVVALVCSAPEVEAIQAQVRAFSVRTGGAAFDLEEVVDAGAYASVLAEARRATPVRPREKPAEEVPPEPAAQAVRGASAPAAVLRSGGARVEGHAAGASPASFSARVRMATLHRAAASGAAASEPPKARRFSFRVIWLALLLLPLAGWRLTGRVMATMKAIGSTGSGASYRQVLRVEVRSRGSSGRVAVLRALPALVGCSEGAQIRFDPSPGAPARPDFELDVTPKGAVFRSPVPLNVNGVARTHKMLRPGDSVAFDGHRVVFRDVAVERVAVSRPALGFPWELVLLGGALLAGLLFWQPVTVSLPARVPARLPGAEQSMELPVLAALSSPRESVAIEAPQRDAPRAAVKGGGASGGTARPVPLRVIWRAVAASKPPPVVQPAKETSLYLVPPVELKRTAVTVFSPGQAADYPTVDALFIHAHPDDESIDFGVLLTRISAAGKRSAVVLLTDGESGLDQYPDRATEGMYARRGLLPEELAAIRPLEAKGALELLGAGAYVRLGLRNHPYASSRQVLSLEALLADWGGEEAMISRLAGIIEGFAPAIVVSPDGPHGGAHEHFEHTGTGYLVEEALRRVRERGRHTVLAHLRSVDPRFLDAYDGEEGIDALETIPGGLTLRGVQVRALKEHQTQRDATVVAVENLTSQRSEYYVATFQRDPRPLDRFLRTW